MKFSLIKIKSAVKSQNFRHGMLYTIFSFINSGISFILLLILAKFLTPLDYGQLNLFNTFVTLTNIILTLCTTSYVGVCFFQKDKETLRAIILIVVITTTFMLGILSLALLLFPTLMEKCIGVQIRYLWIGLLICYFQVFNTLNLDIWRLEEKPISYGLYSVSFAICNFILSFCFIVALQFGWEGRIYAWGLLGLIYFLVSVIFLIKRRYFILTKLDTLLFKETLIYALPILPHSISFWMKQGLDRYFINYFHGQTAVGYFSIALNLAAIISIVGTAFNATNSVYIYKKLAEGYYIVKGVLSKQTNIMTFVFLGVSLFVILFAWGLISLFLPEYEISIMYIVPLCFGAFFQCIYLLWVNYLFYYKKTKQLMHITLGTAIIQMILSFWLTRYSIVFTAIISMIIFLLTVIMVRYKVRKVLKEQILLYINNQSANSQLIDN